MSYPIDRQKLLEEIIKIRDSEKAFDEAAVQLVTCGECAFAYQFHHALHCKKRRRASEPLTDMMVEQTGYCSEGRMK